MNKYTKKHPPRDREKTQAVNWVAKKFAVSSQYVYGILNGLYTNGQADDIKKAFFLKYDQLKKILS